MMLLQADELAITFGGVRAIDGVDLKVASGQVFSIIGPNGSGKTTLLNLASGIYTPHRGSIRFAGHEVTRLAPDQLARRADSKSRPASPAGIGGWCRVPQAKRRLPCPRRRSL